MIYLISKIGVTRPGKDLLLLLLIPEVRVILVLVLVWGRKSIITCTRLAIIIITTIIIIVLVQVGFGLFVRALLCCFKAIHQWFEATRLL